MLELKVPSVDETALYDRICGHRLSPASEYLRGVRNSVLAAYTSYVAESAHSLDSICPDEEAKKALWSNYETIRTGVLNSVGSEVLARSRVCCLCGLRRSSQLDHYLPKREFPEFSAFTLNLIPVCSVCNQKKGRTVKSAAGGPAFFHAYSQGLIGGGTFIKCEIKCEGMVVPSFLLFKPAGMSDEVFETLSSQCEYFDLPLVYSEEAVELLAEKSVAIKVYYGEGGALLVREYLLRECESVRTRFGSNHWKTATLSAAGESDDFCEGGFRYLL